MWMCPKCKRVFGKTAQPHSCHTIPLEEHFKKKQLAKEVFEHLFKKMNDKIGPCRIISLPCCIHLFGTYDFLAALPKKYGLEIRFNLGYKLNTPRLKLSVPVSSKTFKNCLYITTKKEINEELMKWLGEAFFMKDKNQ